MKKITCPVCRSEDHTTAAVGHTFIRHQDFLPMKRQPKELQSCGHCRTSYLRDDDVSSELDAMYRGEEYAKKRKSEHVVFAPRGAAAPRTTYVCMAELIAAQLGAQNPARLLDIGCFDGKLSTELGRLYPVAELHGFDVSEHIGEIFPKDARYRYHCGDLNRIDGRYDLITIVNTMPYVPDLPGFMERIDALLAPGGAIFHLNPNAAKNPFFFTCGDQFIYTTPASMRNFWGHFGYATEIVTDDPSFPRGVLGTARRIERKGAFVYEDDDTLSKSLAYLSLAAAEVRAAVSEFKRRGSGGRVVALGATNNAAWAFHTLGKDLSCFADENPNRAGRKFYGLDVVSPASLDERDLLLVPYAESARSLAEKIARVCKAQVRPF